LPTSRADPSIISSRYQVGGQSDIYPAVLAQRQLVADYAKDYKKTVKGSKKSAYEHALYRIIEEHRMGIRSRGHPRVPLQSVKAFLIAISLESSTVQEYTRIYARFRAFLMYSSIDYTHDSISDFIAYLSLIQKGATVPKVIPALTYFSELEGWPLLIDPLLYRVKSGAMKLWHRIDKSPLERDPILSPAIIEYIDAHKDDEDQDTYFLTCAILTVGFRLLLRPGDIAEREWGDVSVDPKNVNRLKIDLSGHKTDKLGLEKPEILDPIEDSIYCPVYNLNRYMRSVRHNKTAHSPLFSKNGYFFSTEGIQEIITQAIPGATYKGHSLRIGGATELAMKGASMETIMVGGRWKSDSSTRLYLRKLALAENNLSNVMLGQQQSRSRLDSDFNSGQTH